MDITEVSAGSHLPENHEDQLQLGFRMIQNAFNSRVQTMEQEARGLRLTCEEQKSQGAGLQRKNSLLEVELVEGHQRATQLSDENKELFKTVTQLRRQLGRLEGLRKNVLDSIADHQLAEVEQDDNKLYRRDDFLRDNTPLTMAALQGESGHYSRPVSPPPQQPPAQRPPSPGPLEAPPVDGKQFFRKARSSLSYEAFNEFLANIKRLNNQQQTREETLEQARHIFGPEQHHLYQEFEHLLNRHASPVF